MTSALKDKDLAELGVGIRHHFGGGVYVKETTIPRGTMLAQHSHAHDHLSYLVRGSVVVARDGVRAHYHAPACITIVAGEEHEVRAVSDAVWLCIWPTDCTDPEAVDGVVGR